MKRNESGQGQHKTFKVINTMSVINVNIYTISLSRTTVIILRTRSLSKKSIVSWFYFLH